MMRTEKVPNKNNPLLNGGAFNGDESHGPLRTKITQQNKYK